MLIQDKGYGVENDHEASDSLKTILPWKQERK
jgi:hypothetical protein